jgi:hypothetical protein
MHIPATALRWAGSATPHLPRPLHLKTNSGTSTYGLNVFCFCCFYYLFRMGNLTTRNRKISEKMSRKNN